VPRWPVAGPSEYWLLAISPTSEVKTAIHTKYNKYTQDDKCTHKAPITMHTRQLKTIHTRHSPYYISICGLSLSLSVIAVSFTLFQIRQSLRKKINTDCVSWYLTKLAWNISYFEKKWRDIMKNEWMPFVKYSTCLPECLVNFRNLLIKYLLH